MKIVFFRSVSVLFLIAFGASAFAVVAPSVSVFPVFFFAFAVALSLSRGFFEAFPAGIVIGLLVDVATLGRIGIGSAFIAGLIYTASFFSRRFVVEHGAMTNLFSGMLVGATAFVYPFFVGFLTDGATFFRQWEFMTLLSWGNILFAFGGGILLFPVATFLLRSFDERTAHLGAADIIRR